MYEELIAALHTCVDKDKGCSECSYYEKCMTNTSGKHAAMVDAADAIERLNREVKSLYKILGTHPDPKGEKGERGVPLPEPPKEEE